MLDLLHITALRPGADPNHPQSPNAVNYDEAKAGPWSSLPDPLVLKNGKRVTTADEWWSLRRPEIVEDFDREVYGRVPANTPRVSWEVTATTTEKNGDAPVIVKHLVGHVDSSIDPQIHVDIPVTLTIPANSSHPVPIVLEFSFDPAMMKHFRSVESARRQASAARCR
jgi:hypothetical protein